MDQRLLTWFPGGPETLQAYVKQTRWVKVAAVDVLPVLAAIEYTKAPLFTAFTVPVVRAFAVERAAAPNAARLLEVPPAEHDVNAIFVPE